eukprot:6191168-Pleurochrysis_carterae.AAC.2
MVRRDESGGNDNNAGNSDCEEAETEQPAAQHQHPRDRKYSAYGSSQFGSASRTWDEREARPAHARNRTKRPSHRNYMAAMLAPD